MFTIAAENGPKKNLKNKSWTENKDHKREASTQRKEEEPEKKTKRVKHTSTRI